MFPEERYLQEIIGEIIKLFNMSPFIPKNKSEKMNDTSRVSAKKREQENRSSTEEK